MERIDRRHAQAAHLHLLRAHSAIAREAVGHHLPEFIVVLARHDPGGRGSNEGLGVQAGNGFEIGLGRQCGVEIPRVALEEFFHRFLHLHDSCSLG
ncbi:hypothetical protein FQZ97_1004100 [compost metagenome]